MHRSWFGLALLMTLSGCGDYAPPEKSAAPAAARPPSAQSGASKSPADQPAPATTAAPATSPGPSRPEAPSVGKATTPSGAIGLDDIAHGPVRIRIDKETTYVLGPVDNRGDIDFLAAIREKCSKGVTPENNAAIPFWQAAGPLHIPPDRREEYFKSLGIPSPGGDYFAGLHLRAVAAAKNESPQKVDEVEKRLRKEVEALAARPWPRSQSLEIARWFVEDAGPLAKLIEASARPRYFSPLLSRGNRGLLGLEVYDPPLARDVAVTLVARAMLSVSDGKLQDAGRDLQACHRLARLVAQGPTTLHYLTGFAMDRYACVGDAVLAQQTALGADRMKRYVRTLQKMGACGHAAEMVDFCERLTLLDATCRLARTGPATMLLIRATVSDSPDLERQYATSLESARQWHSSVSMDWNEVLRRLNVRVDRLVAALKTSDLQERDRALADFEGEMKTASSASDRFNKPPDLDVFASGKLPEGAVPQHFVDWLSCELMPSAVALAQAEDLATSYGRLSQLALALGAYRAEENTYPASLAKLAPGYIDEVPKDPCSGKNFLYRAKGDSFVLYGVGPNRRDDGAREAGAGTDTDDIVVRSAEP